VGIRLNRLQGRGIVFQLREFEQLLRIVQLAVKLRERLDDRFKRLLFLAQFLRALLVIPDRRVFQRGIDLA
jgi:hypothetical protein